MIFMGKKKEEIEDEEEYEDDEFEEDSFTCRECKGTAVLGEGDDMLLLCEDCMEKYDTDKLWEDFDDGKIDEEDLPTIDLAKYAFKKGK